MHTNDLDAGLNIVLVQFFAGTVKTDLRKTSAGTRAD